MHIYSPTNEQYFIAIDVAASEEYVAAAEVQQAAVLSAVSSLVHEDGPP